MAWILTVITVMTVITGTDSDPIISWSWAVRMISPQEVDLTEQVKQDVTEPTATIEITVPGSYVVGLTVESQTGLAHWNNSALIVLTGAVPQIGQYQQQQQQQQPESGQPGLQHQQQQQQPGLTADPSSSQPTADAQPMSGNYASPPPCIYDPFTQTLINCRVKLR
jgi:hypothetical protein